MNDKAEATPNGTTQEDPAVIQMTDYERFQFDLKGFLVIPNVLSDEETETVRDHIDILRKSPESLPEPPSSSSITPGWWESYKP